MSNTISANSGSEINWSGQCWGAGGGAGISTGGGGGGGSANGCYNATQEQIKQHSMAQEYARMNEQNRNNQLGFVASLPQHRDVPGNRVLLLLED